MDFIEITGYRSLQSERIELRPINILIGANGSGKSNFITFFELLNRLYHQKLANYIALQGGADRVLHKGQKVTTTLAFRLSFKGGQYAYAVGLSLGNSGFVFTSEQLTFKGQTTELGRASQEAAIKITQTEEARYVGACFSGLRSYHFHDTTNRSPFTKLSHVERDSHYLYGDGANLAAFLYSMRRDTPTAYRRIIQTIQSIAPYFSDFLLEPNAEQFVGLQWTDRWSELVYGSTDLSDGTLRFVALAVVLLQPQPPDTLILDEPELGLHPAAIAKLAGMIRAAAAKDCQVIVATQSPDLIGYFDPEDILTVDQVDGASKFKRLSRQELHQWLEEYTLDDLWRRSIIDTGQPNF